MSYECLVILKNSLIILVYFICFLKKIIKIHLVEFSLKSSHVQLLARWWHSELGSKWEWVILKSIKFNKRVKSLKSVGKCSALKAISGRQFFQRVWLAFSCSFSYGFFCCETESWRSNLIENLSFSVSCKLVRKFFNTYFN